VNNQELWKELHLKKRFRPKYPEGEVVRWLFKNIPQDEDKKVLDDGCGAGRHVMLLAENGYIPYGIDFSESGVDYTRQLLTNRGYTQYVENVICGSCDSLPYENNFYDGLISFGVLYYLDVAAIRQAVKEIYRVLKKMEKLSLLLEIQMIIDMKALIRILRFQLQIISLVPVQKMV